MENAQKMTQIQWENSHITWGCWKIKIISFINKRKNHYTKHTHTYPFGTVVSTLTYKSKFSFWSKIKICDKGCYWTLTKKSKTRITFLLTLWPEHCWWVWWNERKKVNEKGTIKMNNTNKWWKSNMYVQN